MATVAGLFAAQFAVLLAVKVSGRVVRLIVRSQRSTAVKAMCADFKKVDPDIDDEQCMAAAAFIYDALDDTVIDIAGQSSSESSKAFAEKRRATRKLNEKKGDKLKAGGHSVPVADMNEHKAESRAIKKALKPVVEKELKEHLD